MHIKSINSVCEREALALKTIFQKRAQLSQAAFGKEYGIGSGAMVYQYLTGRRSINLLAASRFARGLRVSLSDFSDRLATEAKEILAVTSSADTIGLPQAEYVTIPFVKLLLNRNSAKYRQSPLLPVSSHIAFRRDWMASNGYSECALLAVRSDEQGMRTTISASDAVVINTRDNDLVEQAVYAFNYEGQLLLRRTFRDIGSWWLTCDNPDSQHFPRKCFVEKHCYTIGKVVHRQSEIM